MADEEFDFLLHVDDNIADTLLRLGNLSKGLDQAKKELEGLATVSKKNKKAFTDLELGVANLVDVSTEAVKAAHYGHTFKDAAKDVEGLVGKVKDLRAVHAEALDAQTKGQEELAKQKTAEYKERFKMISQEKKAVLDSMSAQSKKLKKIFVEDKKKLDEFAEKKLPETLGKGIGNAIKSALGGDLQGVIGGLGQSAGGLGQLGAGRIRNKSQQISMRRQMAGKGKGGLPGGGKAMAALGKFAKVLGPLAIAVGGLGAIVKLLMDAEAQTKELNSELLNQVPYYTLAQDGFEGANDRLSQMREVATDFSRNMRLGMDPKMHYEVIGALQEHNANLMTLEEGYADFGAMAADVIETVRQTSLNMGTSLSETAGFVAELRDIHGRSMDVIKSDLQLMVTLSREAGISTKKFFGTIAQLSGQMGLYNFKLEEAAGLLTQMNKIMDSKSAEAFTTQMVTGIKNMNGQDRLRKIILAGQGKMQKELQQVTRDMFVDIQKVDKGFVGINKVLAEMGVEGVSSASELQERLKELQKSGRYQELMFQTNSKAGEEVGRALSMAGKMSSDVEAGGLRLADALGNLGALGSVEMEVRIAEGILGPLENISLIEAEALGYNEEQLKFMQRFTEISRGQTKVLMRQYKNFQAGLMSEEDLEAFAEGMGIQAIIEDGNLVNAKTNQLIQDEYDVQRAMTEDAKERAKDSAKKQMTAAEKQVAATQKVGDILQYIIYDVLNSISGTVEGLYGFLVKALSFLDDSPKESDMEVMKREKAKEIRDKQRNVRELRRSRMKATTEREKEAITEQITVAERDIRYEQELLDQRSRGGSVTGHEGFKKYVMGGGDLGFEEFQKLRNNLAGAVRNRVSNQVAAQTEGGTYLPTGQEAGKERRRLVSEALQKELPKEFEAATKIQAEGNALQEEILAGISEGEKTRAQQVAESNRILESKGININTEAAKKFRDAQIEAYEIAAMTDRLRETFGSKAGIVARMLHATGGEGAEQALSQTAAFAGGTLSAAQQAAIKAMTEGKSAGGAVKPAQDAKILTSGIAPLAFSPGDLVIKESAIARTQRGGPGSMLKALGGAAGGGGGGGTVNFNVTVNNPQQGDVQEEILRAYEMIKRKEMGG
jgi:hypothetical protein